MTHATTITRKTTFGHRKVVYGYITLSSYTASGEVISASADFGLTNVEHIMVNMAPTYLARWDGDKIRAYVITTGVEASALDNVGVIYFEAIGY